MLPAAGFLMAERAGERPKDRLRNDHSALAACRRVRHCLCQRIADRDRSARTQLDQSARCRASGRQRMDGAYAGGHRAGRGVARICRLFGAIRSWQPRPAGQGPAAWTFRPEAGQARILQHRSVLGLLRHDAHVDGQRRAVVFRPLRRQRHGDAALVRNVGDTCLCRPPCPEAFAAGWRVAVASHLSPHRDRTAAAAARCS